MFACSREIPVLDVLACSRKIPVLDVLACSRDLLTCLQVYLVSMFACFMSLPDRIFYILALVKYLTGLRACALDTLVCLI